MFFTDNNINSLRRLVASASLSLSLTLRVRVRVDQCRPLGGQSETHWLDNDLMADGTVKQQRTCAPPPCATTATTAPRMFVSRLSKDVLYVSALDEIEIDRLVRWIGDGSRKRERSDRRILIGWIDGVSQFTPNTLACDDGIECTGNDVCSNGVCAGGTALPLGSQCFNGNLCIINQHCIANGIVSTPHSRRRCYCC